MKETTDNMAAEPKKYELRKLEAKDIAPMTSIIAKIGIKEIKGCFNPADIQELISGKNADAAASAVGLSVVTDIAGVILTNYEKCQSDIFKLLASLADVNVKQIESLSIDVFMDMVIDVIKKEEFKDFFKVVSKLFK